MCVPIPASLSLASLPRATLLTQLSLLADLMITVGSCYMSVPGAPIKEIMKDMMEMTRGVQHPTRGLFLRHYLSGMTRDHLPIGESPGCVLRLSAPYACASQLALAGRSCATSRRGWY